MSTSRLLASSLRSGASSGLSRESRMLVNRTMATVQSRIGDKKVEMSNLEKGKYINYQRIEDNLQIVRARWVQVSVTLVVMALLHLPPIADLKFPLVCK